MQTDREANEEFVDEISSILVNEFSWNSLSFVPSALLPVLTHQRRIESLQISFPSYFVPQELSISFDDIILSSSIDCFISLLFSLYFDFISISFPILDSNIFLPLLTDEDLSFDSILDIDSTACINCHIHSAYEFLILNSLPRIDSNILIDSIHSEELETQNEEESKFEFPEYELPICISTSFDDLIFSTFITILNENSLIGFCPIYLTSMIDYILPNQVDELIENVIYLSLISSSTFSLLSMNDIHRPRIQAHDHDVESSPISFPSYSVPHQLSISFDDIILSSSIDCFLSHLCSMGSTYF
jgi:hypothetical protein